MNNQTISCHQVGIIASILLLTLKFTNLPALLYNINGIGGIITILIIFLFNFIFIGIIIWLKSKYKSESLYNILSKNIGVFFTKILYIIFFLFFISKILSLLSDSFGFIRDVADEEFTAFNFLICFVPVCLALAKSGIRNIGRTAEFFFPYIMVGLAISILLSFVPVDIWGVGTQIKGSMGGLFKSLAELSFWNGDLFALLIFIDKIEIKRSEIKRIITPFIIIGFLLVCTYCVYYSLYQQTSIFHTNMLYDIVQYAIGTSSGWHMDIFAIIVFSICILIQGGIFVLCANECLKKIFNFENDNITLTAIVLLLIFDDYLFLDDYFEFVTYAKIYLSWFATIIIILVPILLAFISLKRSIKDARC
ncbi:MAG: GerAB/ArcD/ProY family transporter [Clostridia bacterium]|nr:GerAB/ArcD/ProY family transporter [Clostridia bacterium]